MLPLVSLASGVRMPHMSLILGQYFQLFMIMKYHNYSFTREANTYYDQGLRAYMLSIYQNMSMALGISALVAYIVGSKGQIAG